MEEKFRVVLGQPLPLLTCAAYLCDAACSLDCLSVAQETYKITHSHFYEIQTPAENLMDSEGELKLQSYTFNRQLLQQASPSILKAFNHAIVKIVGAGSKNVPQFKEAPGATAMKYCRLFRLNACQILCTAIELAEMAGDINLQLVSASKCMDHLHPLVSDDGIGSFTTGCIFLVHRALTNSIHSLENERVKGLLEYFVPATQLLLRALTHAKHYGEAARVCDSSLSYIRKHVAIKELKVLNSNLWEQSVGLQKSEIGSQNALASSEFSFHETLAGTKNWKAGYNQVMNPLDEFCEYLEAESVLFRNKVDAQNVILSQRSLEKREIQRKVLDSSTTVRDLFVALELSQAPEAVYYDLLRFRKNPRYLELCHLVINWACRAGCVDLASKLCFELEEWLSKRNIAFFTFSSISEGSMKWEIAFRKNKKKKLASFKNIGESRYVQINAYRTGLF